MALCPARYISRLAIKPVELEIAHQEAFETKDETALRTSSDSRVT